MIMNGSDTLVTESSAADFLSIHSIYQMVRNRIHLVISYCYKSQFTKEKTFNF